MDVGGLNGALLDPMSMTDAELLDVPSLPDIEETLGVDKLDDVASVLGQNTVVPDNNKISELEQQNSEKDAQIGSLNAEVTSLKGQNAQLSEKIELYEDELTDLREQFTKLEDSNQQQTVKISELEKL